MAFKDCGSPGRPVFYAVDNLAGEVHVIYARCKMWKCAECSEYLAYIWALRIGHGIDWYKTQGLSRWLMVTITSHEKLKTTDSCLAVWPKVWGKLSTRMRRLPGLTRYVLIPEQHKDGRVHFHALTSAKIDTRWAKDNARQCGAGFAAQVDLVENGTGAVYYVSKYIGKQAHKTVWPRGFRRVRTSARWPVLPEGEKQVYNDLVWRKWRENGESGYFGLMSAMSRLYPAHKLLCDDMLP